MFRSLYRMSGSGRLALPDVWEWSAVPSGCPEWSGGPSGCPGVVGRPSQMSLSFGRPFWMSGSCQEAHWKSGRPSRLFGSHWETLPDVQEWLGGPPGCLGLVGRPY